MYVNPGGYAPLPPDTDAHVAWFDLIAIYTWYNKINLVRVNNNVEVWRQAFNRQKLVGVGGWTPQAIGDFTIEKTCLYVYFVSKFF